MSGCQAPPPHASIPLFFQPPEVAAFALLRRAAAANAFLGRRKPLHPAQLDLFGRWRWCVVGVELARTRLRYVCRLEFEHLDDTAAATRNLDPDGVSRSYGPMRFATVTVDLDPATLARGLRLRACFVDTRHIKPDIEPHGIVFRHRRNSDVRVIRGQGRS